jgi:hypothetical protein
MHLVTRGAFADEEWGISLDSADIVIFCFNYSVKSEAARRKNDTALYFQLPPPSRKHMS